MNPTSGAGAGPGTSRAADRRAGERPALVLVHGYFGSAEMWRDQVRRFGEDFDVIAPDLAGFGDHAHEIAPDTMEGHVGDILRHLETKRVDRFFLVGHSMGGMIAQQLAATVPDRIAGLVLYGTGPRGALPDRFESIATSRARLRADGVAATARRIAATWFRHGENAVAFDLCARIGAKAGLQAALAGLDAMESWNGEANLARLAVPTLVVWGDGDRSYSWPQVEALWRCIPGADLAVIPGCAHNAHQEKPDIFNAILADFLHASVTGSHSE